MADMMEKMLERPIRLADQVAKIADEAQSSKQDCLEIKAKTEELAGILRHALRAGNKLHERPTRRIIDDTKQVLEKALELVSKCSANGIMKRIFTFKLPTAVFRKTSMQLENSISDVSWLLRLSADGYLGIPPIAAKEPLLCRIWEQIVILHNRSSLKERSLAADSLVSLARDNDRGDKLIIEEGGLSGLLKLAKEGSMEAQAASARAIGLLGRDSENVEHIVKAGVCFVFAKILKEGHMKVQAMVAWAISELAGNHPKYCQYHFVRHNTIRLLVSHLAFETIQEQQVSLSGTSIKRRELEEPAATKAQMKAMAAKALWQLSKGNSSICQYITESRGQLCFAILLEKGAGDDVQFYSAMALMEITAVAEKHSLLRRAAFKPSSDAAKAVVKQLLRIVEANSNSNSNSNLLVPCIKSLGNLACTFQASETRIIEPLVRLLDKGVAVVSIEAATIALNKFACTDNFLHDYHCKAVIDAGGAKHLFHLVYFGKQMVQLRALILLCYIALHVPHSETLAQEEVLAVLEWSSKQAHLVEEPSPKSLLLEAKGRLELYQS
ncbi:uncharacterized protein LOC132185755 [Corylus avellana]|uniref:uncharacterized protein LOC132185755 n=1 Tax=Corylus avellana TaxID=13451 RepID=UPI00286D189D|nr:uncharacterized protein LOC132185755 [Corylus avellana]